MIAEDEDSVQPIIHSEALKPDFSHPVYEKKASRYHPKQVKIALSIIVAVVLLGIVFAVIAALQMTSTSTRKKTAPVAEKSTPKKTLTAAIVTDHLRVYFKGTETARSSLSTAIETKDHRFYTIIPDVEMVKKTSIGGNLDEAKVEPHITALEKSLDYDEFLKFQVSDGVGINNYVADFIRDDVICQIQSYKPTTPKAPTFLEVKCADIVLYDDYAKQQDPFYQAHQTVQSISVPTGLIGHAAIESSKAEGYLLAEIALGSVAERRPLGSGVMTNANSRAMYYSGKDKVWHYFTTRVQDVATITCEMYEVKDALRIAYQGKPCYSLAKKKQMVVEVKKR